MSTKATNRSRFTISGVGCCLLDYIYGQVDFGTDAFAKYRSQVDGDGGLSPGKLTFGEEFAQFAGRDADLAVKEITAGKPVDAVNVGGPAVVALIHAAQILDPERFAVRFVGAVGADDEGVVLRQQLARTPLSPDGLITTSGRTPRTEVLSDPGYDHGRGERAFLNTIGAAGSLTEADLSDDFFDADLIVFGGTALVPQIHDSLDRLLARARQNKAFTVVNTVYDFRNQRRDPDARWPLGSSDESYRLIDLLIADLEEAERLSGCASLDTAMDFFIQKGVGAVIVTNGSRDVALKIGSARFEPCTRQTIPVSQAIVAELAAHPERKGDTTGCGDNFAGGVIADVARQVEAGNARIDLTEAIAWGTVSGGLACFQFGGVLYEEFPGQKRAMMATYLESAA